MIRRFVKKMFKRQTAPAVQREATIIPLKNVIWN